ncbi:unnamed protein product [Urochloa humidicola]
MRPAGAMPARGGDLPCAAAGDRSPAPTTSPPPSSSLERPTSWRHRCSNELICLHTLFLSSPFSVGVCSSALSGRDEPSEGRYLQGNGLLSLESTGSMLIRGLGGLLT